MLPEQFPPAFISSIFGHTFASMYSSSGKSSFNSTGGWRKGMREGVVVRGRGVGQCLFFFSRIWLLQGF